MRNDEWVRRDLAALWHPCTQMHDHERVPLLPIARGEGCWLIDFEGNRYLDAISSWWVNLFGHNHPRINAALKDQVDRLAHVLFAGVTHEPAVRLAEELLRAVPDPLRRVFYADNGASAIEVALKMSFHAWRNAGLPQKRRFIALQGGYHGETLGALSVTDVPLYRETYAPLLMQPIFAPSPDAYLAEPGESAEAHALRQAWALEQLVAEHHAELCALILEPLVQGARGMRMYHPAYLSRARDICTRYQVHLIADEIAVGLGRTGTFLACEQAQVCPDFLVLSKGLTGGYLPLASVLTTESIYAAFYAEYSALKAFLHSHSYTGNPLACRAALATLQLFREQPVIERNRTLAQTLSEALDPLRDHPHVGDVRQCGMIAALELVADRRTRTPFPWQERRGLHVYLEGLRRNVLLRPLGQVVYFIPPYAINADEIRYMVRVAAESIDRAVADHRPTSVVAPALDGDVAALET